MTLDEDARRELLALFLEYAEPRLETLRSGLETPAKADLGRLADEAHTLAGSAASAGLEAAADAARALEQALERAETGRARTLLAVLEAEVARAAGRRVVVAVDDDPASRFLLEQVARRFGGVTLLAARTAAEGEELARAARPDLVLLDLVLPDRRGEELLRALRADAATADLAVVVLSADTSPGREAALRAAGATGFVTKPVDIEQLRSLLVRGP